MKIKISVLTLVLFVTTAFSFAAASIDDSCKDRAVQVVREWSEKDLALAAKNIDANPERIKSFSAGIRPTLDENSALEIFFSFQAQAPLVQTPGYFYGGQYVGHAKLSANCGEVIQYQRILTSQIPALSVSTSGYSEWRK